jgi:Spy/CpxP family protein refolding chaperone
VKKTLFITMALMILSLSATTLSARGNGKEIRDGRCGGPGMSIQKPFRHLEMLQYHFDLTNAQVDKIYKIDKDYMDKFHQNRNDADKIKNLREEHRGEIENILTPEQKVRWNEFAKNRPVKKRDNKRDNKRDRGFGAMSGLPGMHIGFMQRDLKLSDDQIDKIYKIRKDNMDKFYQARNDGDKVRELSTRQDAEVEKVLTAEQLKKWKEFKSNQPCDGKPGKGRGQRGMIWDDDTK